jgi:hypothetical protein
MHKGSRIIIIVVQIGAVKIYVAAVEAGAPRKRKERLKLTYYQNWWVFFEFQTPLNANVLFCTLKKDLTHTVYDQT